MNQVLIITPDEASCQSMSAILQYENFSPLLARTADAGLEALYRSRPQLVIVDLPLAGVTAADFCRQLRGPRHRTPIIFLSPVRDDLEAVLLLELGADDYLVRPFHPRELRARMRAILRRTGGPALSTIQFGDVEIDPAGRNIRCRGEEIRMTRNEYNLLLYFIRNAGRVLTRDVILQEVWGYDQCPDTRTVDAHVGKLRNKLEAEPRLPRHFVTIHGVGYRFLMKQDTLPRAQLSAVGTAG